MQLTSSVTVCLPCLNTNEFIQERLETIEAQSLPPLEVVVVDGYSTDGTFEAVSSWAASRPGWHVGQRPRGLYQAWNRCIELSHGEWIYIATSDDVMSPRCLETLVRAGEDTGAELVSSDEWIINEVGDTIEGSAPEKRARLLRLAESDPDLGPRLLLLSGMLFGTPFTSITQLLVRRSVFKRISAFSTDYGSFGDYDWQLRVLVATRWTHVRDKLGAWRIHQKQATPLDSGKIYDARMRILCDQWKAGIIPRKAWYLAALVYVCSMANQKMSVEMPWGIRFWANVFRRCPSVLRSVLRALLCAPGLKAFKWLVG